ncbi:MAG: epoxyqueuosine reductase QueH [Oscillospiraceae bacterium]|nr:epoxyqueuosine reductase QueH [Oscillospiraceae bacterium]
MRNYEIFFIRDGGDINNLIKQGYHPNVGRVYTSPQKSCIETAGLIYPHHELYKVENLREYDFERMQPKSETPVFTQRCVKGIEEIFADMSRAGIYKAAAVTHLGVIVTLLAGCGIPKAPPTDFEIEPGEAWLISMSAYLWQKGNVFEIVGKLIKKPRLLLHSCCAPCSSAVLERLCPDYDVTVFFYNPNVQPQSEYQKRLEEQKRFLEVADFGESTVELIEGEYSTEKFKSAIRGLEHLPEESKGKNSQRCEMCYRLRLEETARTAAEEGFDCFASTLTLSSKKKASVINPIAEEFAAKYDVEAVLEDFKKKDGYNRSVELCNEYGLYRQNYCGCKEADS